MKQIFSRQQRSSILCWTFFVLHERMSMIFVFWINKKIPASAPGIIKIKNRTGHSTNSVTKIRTLAQADLSDVKLVYPIISQMNPPPYDEWKKLSTASPHIQHHLYLHIGHSICMQPSSFSKGHWHWGHLLAEPCPDWRFSHKNR